MRSTHSELDWVPQRNGEIYCSPACGAHCKFAAYEEACGAAGRLASTLGPGWEPHVWENMNWYYAARYRTILNVHPSGREYAAYADNGKWVGHGDTPIASVMSIRTQLEEAQTEIEDLYAQVRRVLFG